MFSLLRRPGLRAVFLAQVVLPVLGAVVLIFSGAMLAGERLIEQRMKEDVGLVARAIRMPVSYSLRVDEPVSLMTALESVFEIGRVYGAHVYDREGRQVAAAGMAGLDESERIDIEAVLDEHAGDNPRAGGGSYAWIDGMRTYAFYIPLLGPDDSRAGLLQVTRRFSDFTNYMRDLRWRAMAAFTVIVVLMVGLILVSHHRAIGRPLRRLVASMDRVKRGELGHRAQVSGPRELATLGTAYNDMLDGIERARVELVRRERAERALTERLRETEKMAAVGRLSTGIAHELGTPLSVVDGRARRIERGADDRHAGDLATIRGEVRRMTRIVGQLLDFGRGRQTEHRRVDIDRIARSAFGGVQDVADEHGVALDYVTEGDDFAAEGDPLRLEQAISNLLRNGVQAAARGMVRLTLDATPTTVSVRVADTGPGIPEEQAAHVFEPFFTTKKVGEGTGLGLSVARGVADEHGARITVSRDAALGGACFLLELPRASRRHDTEDNP